MPVNFGIAIQQVVHSHTDFQSAAFQEAVSQKQVAQVVILVV